ncbi:Hypothetical predicted protein [Olea europaea subsp. europaea]|uniref:Uncharacterized protein n=1 Tax=Olea europaea subsp. europaea TaxID=158383 RepID=A0A8S0V7G4_OLEEU|nr:Hypothetical predicted protein [Olea europaea subsp. europaea]
MFKSQVNQYSKSPTESTHPIARPHQTPVASPVLGVRRRFTSETSHTSTWSPPLAAATASNRNMKIEGPNFWLDQPKEKKKKPGCLLPRFRSAIKSDPISQLVAIKGEPAANPTVLAATEDSGGASTRGRAASLGAGSAAASSSLTRNLRQVPLLMWAWQHRELPARGRQKARFRQYGLWSRYKDLYPKNYLVYVGK